MNHTEKDVKWWTWASVWMMLATAVLVGAALIWRHQQYAPPVPTKGYTQIKLTTKTADGVSVMATVELASKPEDKDDIAPYKSNVAVALTGLLAAQDRDALIDKDNRAQLKQMMLDRANKILPPGKKADKVLMTEFLLGGG